MTIYAVGDIQGCYDELKALLDKLKFDFRCDTLWFTGDLVNRGPRSLEVLRFVKSMGECAVTVLGNHDLHLLAVAYGHEPAKKNDTLDAILQADDREELLFWLRTRPLIHHDELRKITLVHAGLTPQWTLNRALQCAEEVEKVLSGNAFNEFLANMYGNLPARWDDALQGWDRLRFITNCCTRLRYVDAEGNLDLTTKGAPGSQPKGYFPWFRSPLHSSTETRILFGHWSTHGFAVEANTVCLDSGCIWGGKLTAISVDELVRTGNINPIHLPCKERVKPGTP